MRTEVRMQHTNLDTTHVQTNSAIALDTVYLWGNSDLKCLGIHISCLKYPFLIVNFFAGIKDV